MQLTKEESELYKIYCQIADSSEFAFPEIVDVSDQRKRMLSDIHANGELTTPFSEFPEFVDYRKHLIDYFIPIKREVEEICRLCGASLPSVFVGPMNDGSLNVTLRSQHMPGVLVLYNDGLKNFFYVAAKLIAGSCSLGKYLERDDIPPAYTADHANEMLAELLHNTYCGDSRNSTPPSIPRAHYMDIVISSVQSCDRFFIAHELGHLFDDSDDTSLEREYEADQLGLEVVCERQKRRWVENTENNSVKTKAEVFAPLLFYELMFILRVYGALSQDDRVIRYEDHPPDLLRRDRLAQSLLCKEVDLDLYRTQSNVLDRFLEYLLSHLEQTSGFSRDSLTIRCALEDKERCFPSSLTYQV